MTALHEADFVLPDAQSLHDAVDAVPGQPEDDLDIPVNERFDENLSGGSGHWITDFRRWTNRKQSAETPNQNCADARVSASTRIKNKNNKITMPPALTRTSQNKSDFIKSSGCMALPLASGDEDAAEPLEFALRRPRLWLMITCYSDF